MCAPPRRGAAAVDCVACSEEYLRCRLYSRHAVAFCLLVYLSVRSPPPYFEKIDARGFPGEPGKKRKVACTFAAGLSRLVYTGGILLYSYSLWRTGIKTPRLPPLFVIYTCSSAKVLDLCQSVDSRHTNRTAEVRQLHPETTFVAQEITYGV